MNSAKYLDVLEGSVLSGFGCYFQQLQSQMLKPFSYRRSYAS